MTDNATVIAGHLLVEFGPDRMSASVRVRLSRNVEDLSVDAVIACLKDAGIAVTEQVTQRAAELVELIAQSQIPQAPFLVATGTPVQKCVDQMFKLDARWPELSKAWQADAPQSYYKPNKIWFADAGDVIGVLRAAVPGKDGLDVCGTVIDAGRPKSVVKVGENITQSESDPDVLIASAPGRIHYENDEISVVEVCTIDGDVNASSGSISSELDIHITGTVREGVEVQCGGSITVEGAIEAAKVEAHGDVVVRGGIVGQTRGTVRAGGEIVAKYCDEADLRADGPISVHSGVVRSHIHTENVFRLADEAVVGGQVFAREGAEVASLGKKCGASTTLIFGIDPRILAETERLHREIGTSNEKLTKLRSTARPLLSNQKHLTAQQKEWATELMFQADTIEEGVTDMERQRNEMLAAAKPRSTPKVIVRKVACEGTHIQVGKLRARLGTDFKGPIRIEERTHDGSAGLVVVCAATESSILLPCVRVTELTEQTTPAESEEGDPVHGSGS